MYVMPFLFVLSFFKSEGKLVIAMDALFGLPQKKSAGTSYRDPLFEHLFFHDQFIVDEFVAENDSNKSPHNVRINCACTIVWYIHISNCM